MKKEGKSKIKTTKTVIIVVAAVLGVQALLFAAYLIISSLSETDGECYISMKEFADVMGFEIAITE